MKRKRTKAELERLAADFEGRAAWLESAWSCRTEYEIDLADGRVWLKITFPANPTALVVRCDIEGITVPGTGTPTVETSTARPWKPDDPACGND